MANVLPTEDLSSPLAYFRYPHVYKEQHTVCDIRKRLFICAERLAILHSGEIVGLSSKWRSLSHPSEGGPAFPSGLCVPPLEMLKVTQLSLPVFRSVILHLTNRVAAPQVLARNA